MSVNSYTVTEALKKICPFIEEEDYNDAYSTKRWPAFCKATECMAWQWETWETDESGRGFCGLTRKG